MVVDLYELLGIPKGAGSREIKGAYRRMAEVYHPDKLNLLPESTRGEGEEIMRLLNEAKDTLLDLERRGQYDILLTGGARTVTVNEMEFIEPEEVSARVKGGGILSQMSRVLGSMREAYTLDHEFTAKIVQAQEIVEARVLEEDDDESVDSSYP
ncbi:MAG: J domain-containing protein, partial [Thermoplasmata archaeon]|nr:J domain-containing protein [Thermoplasmata archaeon]